MFVNAQAQTLITATKFTTNSNGQVFLHKDQAISHKPHLQTSPTNHQPSITKPKTVNSLPAPSHPTKPASQK